MRDNALRLSRILLSGDSFMPRSMRLQAEDGKLDRIRTHTAIINQYLQLLIEWYQKDHPEWAQNFNLAAQLNAHLDLLIEKMIEEI